jgi:two-component system, chemotaxis family, CheB/CheR fusion protein
MNDLYQGPATLEAEETGHKLALLAEMGRAFADLLDSEQMLQRLAALVVRDLADYAVVDIFESGGTVRRAAVAHRTPEGRALVQELQRYPPSLGSSSGMGLVLRTGEPILAPEVKESQLRAAAQDEHHFHILSRLGPKSSILVPLVARGRVLGALALAITEGDRRYGPTDLALAEALATHAAIVVENARLYQAAQDAARQLEENVALLDTLLVSAPVGIAFLDRDLRFVRINAVMAELIGVDSAAVSGRLYREVLPDLAPKVEALHRRVLETGERTMNLEVSGETPAAPGKRRHFLASYYPIISRDGSTAGVGAAMVEITERKRAEEALRETNQTLRALIQACPLAVMVVEPETAAVQLWNPAAERIFGWTEGEALGRSLAIVPDELRETFRHNLQRLTRGESLDGFETVRRTRDGSPIDVSVWAAPVPSPDGVRILAMVADVTERKRIVDERRRLEEELRRRVEELAAADRRKDEFLAMLAHELRNPLAAISNAGYVLGRKGSPDPRSAELLAMIGRQIRHLSRLVDDLLDVSRFSRGLIELRMAPMELHRAVQGAVETARPHLEQRRHTLEVSLPDEPLWLEADVTRIEQVLANLLHNAAKFTPPGGAVRLSAGREGDEAVVRVSDNGAGISPELLPQIFDLFVQEERSLDRSQGGLGIGLTLVRSLVERHGGRVEVASEGPGRGSEFTVRLPLLPASPGVEPSSARDSREAGTAAARLLLVEDNLDAAEALGELLRMWGHEVHVAHDGASALRLAAAERPDVLLLDIGLPGMDGYEVARRLRATPGFERVKLVALTGYGQESDRQRASEAGFNHHLVKPVDLERLRDLLSSPGDS